ncbi:uncharacterized protein FOMMEDRAFT_139651 [Fomitiporia mediterranea MF3/22]|uniref:uncharacterized protein n=1 Tax=Fomitiporia mediterranea (strain MF3/22) TaxID=694068 RepID=UPI0004407337|nr:uncharacterized protein FOMMEDRAFT_139651 [Fomitiporia mediterranea MF3/22]EJD05063.1 hypothetical protein FOMMEDRAFT_139651 [Fomitiporia mediterranea MF3/22]
MQLHTALDATFIGSLRRRLSNRGRARSHSRSSSLLFLDMSEHVDWMTRTDESLDDPATTPAHTLLIFEVPDLQSVCFNHGERQFRVERPQAITVRDVLFELDAFLHRRAPMLVGNFTTLTDEKKRMLLGDLGDREEAPRVEIVNLHSVATATTTGTPDSSESSLASAASTSRPGKDSGESVIRRWLGDKTVFAGLRCSENHDFKLIVRMAKPNGKTSLTG